MESSGNNGGYVESCTIVSNLAYTWGGGLVVSLTNNYLTNCIIYGNVVSVGADKTDVKFHNAGGITTETNAMACCLFTSALSPDPNRGNITNADPMFLNPDRGDYHLNPRSPCLNAGANMNWMVDAVDLDGKKRLRYGRVDMGAYEIIFNGTIYRFY